MSSNFVHNKDTAKVYWLENGVVEWEMTKLKRIYHYHLAKRLCTLDAFDKCRRCGKQIPSLIKLGFLLYDDWCEIL